MKTLKTPFQALLTFVAVGYHASASLIYWDGSDVTANADGGAGTWDTITANWDDAATLVPAVARESQFVAIVSHVPAPPSAFAVTSLPSQ